VRADSSEADLGCFGTSKEIEDLLSTADVVSMCETIKKMLGCS